MATANTPPASDLKRQLQRALFRLVLLVVLVDALAIGAYYVFDLEHAARRPRFLFTIAWMALTLAVVLPIVKRVRELRNRARQQRRAR